MMWSYCTPIRMLKIKFMDSTKHWRRFGKLGFHILLVEMWNIKCTALGYSFVFSLKTKPVINIELQLTLLGIYVTEMKMNVCIKSCNGMFLATLFQIYFHPKLKITLSSNGRKIVTYSYHGIVPSSQ